MSGNLSETESKSNISLFQFERDISVRRRALDLLFTMCNPSNARTIITALVSFLEHAEYAIREEMVCDVPVQKVYSSSCGSMSSLSLERGSWFLSPSYTAQVLKIAILAERDAEDYSFYVDIILNLIRVAGDYVSTEVWLIM